MVEAEKSKEKRVQIRIPSADLEWLITESAAALGARGTLASVTNAIERGGPAPGGLPASELCTDEQLGWGRWHGKGVVQRHRILSTIWSRLDRAHQDVLTAYYTTHWQPGHLPGREAPETVWAGQRMGHGWRMDRVLWQLGYTPTKVDKKGVAVWSKSDREDGELALRLAHEAWELERSKAIPAKPKASRAERVAEELGL